MSAIRNLVQIIVILGMLLVSACTAQAPATSLPNNPGTAAAVPPSKNPATFTPEPLPELDPAVQAGMELCAKIVPGLVCLVEGPAQVTAQPDRPLMPFEKPGQTLNLADIQTLKLGETGSTKGVVVMSIPTEWPGGFFTALAFGDVELVNEVPYGTREFNAMQALKFTTGPNQEGKAPTSGLFVSSPEDGNLSTLVVNGLELTFGSSGWLTSQGGGITVLTVWGSIGAWCQDRVVQIKRGFGLRLTRDEIRREWAEQPYVSKEDRLSETLKKYFGNKEPYDAAYKHTSEAWKVDFSPPSIFCIHG